MVGDRFGTEAEGGAEASQECHKEKAIVGIIAVLPCRENSDHGVGEENEGGGDEGVVLEEAGDQGVADNSHHCVRKDEHDAFQHRPSTAVFAVGICYLVFCHSFRQRDD